MSDKEFKPLNDLESKLLEAQCGTIPFLEMLRVFVTSTIAIPTHTDVKADGTGLSPLTFDRDGTQMLAVFTHGDRATQVVERAGYCLMTECMWFLKSMSSECGL